MYTLTSAHPDVQLEEAIATAVVAVLALVEVVIIIATIVTAAACNGASLDAGQKHTLQVSGYVWTSGDGSSKHLDTVV